MRLQWKHVIEGFTPQVVTDSQDGWGQGWFPTWISFIVYFMQKRKRLAKRWGEKLEAVLLGSLLKEAPKN